MAGDDNLDTQEKVGVLADGGSSGFQPVDSRSVWLAGPIFICWQLETAVANNRGDRFSGDLPIVEVFRKKISGVQQAGISGGGIFARFRFTATNVKKQIVRSVRNYFGSIAFAGTNR